MPKYTLFDMSLGARLFVERPPKVDVVVRISITENDSHRAAIVEASPKPTTRTAGFVGRGDGRELHFVWHMRNGTSLRKLPLSNLECPVSKTSPVGRSVGCEKELGL